MKLTAVIIEDEFKLREVFIQLLKENCPEIDIVGQAGNIKDGYEQIIHKKPNVVFLDIEMPGGNGFEMLERFEKISFETVFVSSYGHYAIKAIKLSALDFLLKPVIIEELIKITNRIKETIALKESALKYTLLSSNLKNAEQDKKIALQTKSKLEYVSLCSILYLKAESNYTSLYIEDAKRYVVSKTLKEYEETLCDESSNFIRIHKTFIVNINQIKSIERGEDCMIILKDNTQLEVSRRKKQQLISKFNSLHR